MGKFEVEKALSVVEKYRVTHLFVVPPVMIALAKLSVVLKYDVSSLKQILSGAASLGKSVMEKVSLRDSNQLSKFWCLNFVGHSALKAYNCTIFIK